MPASVWIGLIGCNLIWSLNPTAGMVLTQEVGPHSAAWLKFAFAFAAYVTAKVLIWANAAVAGHFGRSPLLKSEPMFLCPESGRDWVSLLLIGLCTFVISPMAQMSGFTASTATNSAILVAFEPIFAVLLGWLILGERPGVALAGTFALAVVGFGLLSGAVGAGRAAVLNWGDVLLLIAVAGESAYSVLSRRLVRRYSGDAILGTALLIGLVLLSIVAAPGQAIDALKSLSGKGWGAAFWLGALGTAATYLYWLHALNRSLSLGSVVLSLFLQPVLGAAVSTVILKEQLGRGQLFGGGLIVSAVVVQMLAEQRLRRRAAVTELSGA